MRLLLERAILLQELDIFLQIDNIDSAFNNICIRAPLKVLSLFATGLSDASIPAICQLAGSLRSLDLYQSEKLTSEGKTTCIQIYNFFYLIFQSFLLANKGAILAVKRLPRLKVFRVCQCSKIDNRLLEAAATLSTQRLLNIHCNNTSIDHEAFIAGHSLTQKRFDKSQNEFKIIYNRLSFWC